jgi:hypothetical protein
MKKQNTAILVPSVEGMISDALDTIQTEIARYKAKVERGIPLNPIEAKVMQGYIKSLVELSKEERERAKEADLSDLTLEQLVELTSKQQKQLPKKAAE